MYKRLIVRESSLFPRRKFIEFIVFASSVPASFFGHASSRAVLDASWTFSDCLTEETRHEQTDDSFAASQCPSERFILSSGIRIVPVCALKSSRISNGNRIFTFLCFCVWKLLRCADRWFSYLLLFLSVLLLNLEITFNTQFKFNIRKRRTFFFFFLQIERTFFDKFEGLF